MTAESKEISKMSEVQVPVEVPPVSALYEEHRRGTIGMEFDADRYTKVNKEEEERPGTNALQKQI